MPIITVSPTPQFEIEGDTSSQGPRGSYATEYLSWVPPEALAHLKILHDIESTMTVVAMYV